MDKVSQKTHMRAGALLAVKKDYKDDYRVINELDAGRSDDVLPESPAKELGRLGSLFAQAVFDDYL